MAEQLAALKAERDRLVAEGREATAVKARELARLGAIAPESSFVFATELFGWRTFANRRQLERKEASRPDSVAHAVPRARTPVCTLGRPVRAGADTVDEASFSGSSTRLSWRTRNGVSGDAGRHG